MNRKSKSLTKYHKPSNFSDLLAKKICGLFRWLADTFFQKRYAHRAVVLETIAAVPGMIAGMLIHFKCLRWQRADNGWIKTLLDEAENERMHLMVFMELAKPTFLERILIIIAQLVFSVFFLFLYIASAKTAHRLTGYFEEEAVTSYSLYLQEIKDNNIEDIPAPQIAIDYWGLKPNARLSDMIIAVRNDEAKHRDVNHGFANELSGARKSSIMNSKEHDPNECN